MKPILTGFEEQSRQLDIDFAEYLKGKTVAIVARGGLTEIEQGDFIDSHDVVVRIHDMRPYDFDDVLSPISDPWKGTPKSRRLMNVPKDWVSRVGSKCNICYFCCIVPNEVPLEEKLKSYEREITAFRKIGGKFICAESIYNHCCLGELVWQEHYDIRYLTIDHFLNTMRIIGSTPYAGSIIVTDILRYDIEKVYITGMPFFISREKGMDDPRGEDHYTPKDNLNFLINLTQKYPDRISVDENMKEMWRMINGNHK